MEGLNALEDFLSGIYPLHNEEMAALLAVWQPYSCKRKTLLTKAGETERYLYFVLEGVQRAFYSGDDGHEATIVFTYPPSFSGIADSFLTQTPSRFFLETLTTSRFLRTSHKQLEDLMHSHADILQMVLRLTSFALRGVLERQIELQCFSAEQRFRTLFKRSPHILNLIPHKYLASYLGLDPTTFSKLLGSARL
jgi:CRP-like cAMP-binding protein